MNDERTELGKGKGVCRFSGGDEQVSVERDGKGTGTMGPRPRCAGPGLVSLCACRLESSVLGCIWLGLPGAKKVRAHLWGLAGVVGVEA